MVNQELPMGRITVDYFQSPHTTPDLDPLPALIDAIDGAKSTIHFAIYSLTHNDIANALIRALGRGVAIVGVADAVEADASRSQIHRVWGAGADVRTWGGPYRLMHDKVIVIDGEKKGVKVGLGSYNWTTLAETKNVEVLLMCSGTQVLKGLAPALIDQIMTAHDGGKILS